MHCSHGVDDTWVLCSTRCQGSKVIYLLVQEVPVCYRPWYHIRGNFLVQTIDYDSSNGAVNVSLKHSKVSMCWCLFNLSLVCNWIVDVRSIFPRFWDNHLLPSIYEDTNLDRSIWVWAYQGSTPYLHTAEMIGLRLIWLLHMCCPLPLRTSCFGERI